MKNILLFLAFFQILTAFAQVNGNYEAAKKSSGNYNVKDMGNYNGNYNLPNSNNATAANSNVFMAIPPQYKAQILGDNIIQFDINALSNQKSVNYVAVFNITQIGATAKETDSLLNVRYNNFKKASLAADIAESDIVVDMVSFLPKYETEVSRKLFSKKTYNEIPKGFVLQKNLHIKYKNPQVLDKLVTIAAQNEIYDLVKVDYFVENPAKVYEELREKTFQYLKEIEKSYKDNGFRLDSAYKSIGENSFVVYPNSRYVSYEAYSSNTMDIFEKEVKDNSNKNAGNTINANLMRAEKQTTSFYQMMPQNEYEVVINPIVHEPCVQFSYNIQVKYVLRERVPQIRTEVKREREFIWITPNGDMKTLKID